MAVTSSAVAFQASATNTAGSTATGSWVDLRATLRAILEAKVINGATGPTVACTISVDLSPDNGTTVYAGAGGSVTTSNANSATTAVSFDISGVGYARTVFTGNTAQSVTIQADAMTLTSGA